MPITVPQSWYTRFMDPAPPQLLADDLAPGDRSAAAFDWSGRRIVRIQRVGHPLFAVAYGCLWDEFGARGEMETREVIAARLAWHPSRPIADHALLYEMLVVAQGDEILAVRDHTAIVARPRADRAARVLVHLSHLLIMPRLRGSGLSGWLRALPIQTARECAELATGRAASDVTLVAEMEPPDAGAAAVSARLRSYQRAGFTKIDPVLAPYCQPDFRTAEAIDASTVHPLPLVLVIRRVGHEAESWLSGAEVRETVAGLYTMYGATMRAAHMAPLWRLHADLPAAEARVTLRAPLL
jgi:hypothetical protein